MRRSLPPLLLLALLAARPVAAQDTALPGWLPPALTPPEGTTVARASAVGRMLRVAVLEVPGTPDDLMETWRIALDRAGFTLDPPPEALEDAPILFSGQGIRTGQVVRLPGTPDNVTLIQIDLTLEE